MIDEGTRRIGGYATIWGELDCDQERMTRGAIEPYIGKVRPLMLWMHGLDPHFKANPIGVWDENSFKIDDTGLYTEGNLSYDQYGDEAKKRLDTAGVMGLSVGSVHYLVKRETLSDGTKNLIDWPLMDISPMEGGRQCVPNAQRNLKSDLAQQYSAIAAKLNIDLLDASTDCGCGGGQEKVRNEENMSKKHDEETATTANEEVMAALAEIRTFKAEQAKAKAEQERAAEVEELVNEKLEAERERMKQEVEEKEAEYTAKYTRLQEDSRRRNRVQAPPVGISNQDASPNIQVIASPYDRLSTFDLATRYMVMKSSGQRPSDRFRRALMLRAHKMGREQDQVGTKNGQAVYVPAIDRDVIVPTDLDFDEEGTPFKAGGVPEKGKDNVTSAGIRQFAQIVGMNLGDLKGNSATKANELLYSTQSGFGDEWVPTLQTAALWRTIRLNSRILPHLDQFDMPSNPYDWTTESTDPTWYKTGEATDESQLALNASPYTDSKVGTAKKTFNALKLGALSFSSEELGEDGIIAVEPQLRDQFGMSLAENIDEVILSGDETTGSSNISNDGGAIASTSRYLILDGMRHEALVTTTADSRDGGTLTIDDFGLTRSLMGTAGKLGVNSSQLIIIMDSAVWHKASLLSEVLTIGEFGSLATVVTGQLGSIFGIPIIVPEKYGLTDTAGKISSTGGNNTKGSFIVVNLGGVKMGWARRPRIRVERLPLSDSMAIQGSARFDVQFSQAGAVAMSYNLTV
jgi:HK97 family phage prohead protease